MSPPVRDRAGTPPAPVLAVSRLAPRRDSADELLRFLAAAARGLDTLRRAQLQADAR